MYSRGITCLLYKIPLFMKTSGMRRNNVLLHSLNFNVLCVLINLKLYILFLHFGLPVYWRLSFSSDYRFFFFSFNTSWSYNPHTLDSCHFRRRKLYTDVGTVRDYEVSRRLTNLTYNWVCQDPSEINRCRHTDRVWIITSCPIYHSVVY